MDKKSVSIMTALCFLIFVLFGIIVIDSQNPSDDHYADTKASIQKDADHHAPTAVETQKHAVAEPKKHVEKAASKKAAQCPASKEKVVAHKKAAHKAESKKVAHKPEPQKATAKAAPAAGKTEVADVIMMENPAYAKHKKGIVKFTHKAHVEDYEISCGDCHHDSKGKPLDLKMGDPVQNCIACHPKPSKKTKDAKTKEQILEFHAEAVHMNCIGCHKDYNKKNNTKAAPAGCGKCHPKK
ncbi:cytochrome c, class III family protein [Candidatus Magnetomorum sp. HK-1]|nr:cytochrome c, class III family protein [Candidatus Magnetomorum sp. HK-1]